MVANALRGFLVLGLLVLLAHVVLVRLAAADPFATGPVDVAPSQVAPMPLPMAASPVPATPISVEPGAEDFEQGLDSFFQARILSCASQSVGKAFATGATGHAGPAPQADEACVAGPASLGGAADGDLDGGGLSGLAPYGAFHADYSPF